MPCIGKQSKKEKKKVPQAVRNTPGAEEFDAGEVYCSLPVATACHEENATCETDVPDSTLRSRDRRRLRRHGPDAIKLICDEDGADDDDDDGSCLETNHQTRPASIASIAPQRLRTAEKVGPAHSISERSFARDKKSSDCQIRSCGREGLDGNARVQYNAHGVAFEVDLRKMVQHDASTGQTLKVRRLRAGSWSVKKGSQKSNGWTPYPLELSNELERVYENTMSTALESTPLESELSLLTESSLSALLAHVGSFETQAMSLHEVEQIKRVALEKASEGPKKFREAAKLIAELVQKQGLRCTTEDARKAGLNVGSMSVLKAVLLSQVDMRLFGLEIFDQKYASIKWNMHSRKDCIRCLLARGMILGSHAPSSKLLKKVEADSLPLWKARFLAALLASITQLPEQDVTRIWSFLV